MGKQIIMTALEILINLCKKFEGLRLDAYRDSTGKITIGYGHCGPDITPSSKWTLARCEAVLEIDAQNAINAAIKASPVLELATPGQQAAVADLIYNMGVNRYVGHSVKPLIDAKQFNSAAVEIKKFCHAGGEVEPGLVARRMAESNLLSA